MGNILHTHEMVPVHQPGHRGSMHAKCTSCQKEFYVPGKEVKEDNSHLGPIEFFPMDQSFTEFAGCPDSCKATLPHERDVYPRASG